MISTYDNKPFACLLIAYTYIMYSYMHEVYIYSMYSLHTVESSLFVGSNVRGISGYIRNRTCYQRNYNICPRKQEKNLVTHKH